MKYWIPTGNWSIGTGYAHAHRLMCGFGLVQGTEADYDLLVLPGGADIGARPERDAVEFASLERAWSGGKKVFGICRGMQVMFYMRGYRIIDHIPDVDTRVEHRTLTGDWKGQSSWHRTELGLLVNSRHHQGISGWPGDWEILDRADDGLFEAASRKNEFAVQWHPEHPEMLGTSALSWLKAQLQMRELI